MGLESDEIGIEPNKTQDFETQSGESDILSDCEFLVGPEKVIIKGNKKLFSAASDVFHAMFYGDLKETKPVHVVDLEPDEFEAMKKYIYTGKTDFQSVFEVIYTFIAARKYLIENLKQECVNYISRSLKSSQVIEFLDCCKMYFISEFDDLCYDLSHFKSVFEALSTFIAARKYMMERLKQKCVKYVDESLDPSQVLEFLDCCRLNGCIPEFKKTIYITIDLGIGDVLRSDYFTSASKSTIKSILLSFFLRLKDHFKSLSDMEQWALNEAERLKFPAEDIKASFGSLKKHERLLISIILEDNFLSQIDVSPLLTIEEIQIILIDMNNHLEKLRYESIKLNYNLIFMEFRNQLSDEKLKQIKITIPSYIPRYQKVLEKLILITNYSCDPDYCNGGFISL